MPRPGGGSFVGNKSGFGELLASPPPSLRRTAFIWSADDLDPDLQILGFQGVLAPNSRFFFVFVFGNARTHSGTDQRSVAQLNVLSVFRHGPWYQEVVGHP